MAFSTFVLNVRERDFGNTKPTFVHVKVYPLATASGALLTTVKDTTGNIVLSGHADIKADASQITAGLVAITLPDPRDTTLNPTGFGLRVDVRTNYFSRSVIFGPTEIGLYISGGVLELEDVTSVDLAAFTSAASYAAQGDLTAEVTRATAAEATKVNTSTYTSGQATQDAALASETARATAAETALQNLTNGTFATALNNAFAGALAATAVKTSAYTAAVGDLVPVDATSGALTVTLPTAPADKARIAVKKIDSSTNAVTIQAGGSDVFNKAGGGTTLTLSLLNQSVNLQYKASGAIWYVVADDLPLSQLDARFTAAGAVKWQASTAYATGQFALSPTGQVIQRISSGTSGTSYDNTEQGNWNALPSGPVLAPFAYKFMEILERDSGNLVVAVSGDSKSDGSNEWVQDLFTMLAARYPAFTFVIKNKTVGSNTYQADVTLQTGSGTHTVTIYNWSQSGAGSTVGFDTNANLEVAYPVAPDLFLIATGANDDYTQASNPGATTTRLLRQSIARMASYYPNVMTAMVLLNPHSTSDTFVGSGGTVSGLQNMLAASRNMVTIAEDLGLGVMNLQRAWFELPGGYTSLLADTKHPAVAGSTFLAKTAYDQLVSALKGPTVPQRRRRIADQLYVPLMGGMSFSGSPALTVQASYSNTVGVAFDSVADEAWILPPIELPEWWQSFGVEIDWAPQTNASGNAYFELRYIALAPGSGTGTTVVQSGKACSASASTVGKVITSPLTGATTDIFSSGFTIPAATHTNAKTTGGNYPMMLRLARLASNALDTLETTDALVYGLRLIRGTA